MNYLRLSEPSPIVVLTGAGASKAIGLPTMVEFRKQFSAQLEPTHLPLWNAIIEATAKSNHIGKNFVNIEHILSHLEECEYSYAKVGRLWKRMNGLQHGSPNVDQIHRFRHTFWVLRDRIHRAILSEYGSVCRSKVRNYYTPLFSLFQDLFKQRSTNVFTTNYDLTFETLAEDFPNEFEVADGFNKSSNTYEGEYVPECRAEHSLVLFKLHGSTSWRYDQNAEKIRQTNQLTDDPDHAVVVQPTVHKDLILGRYSRPFNAGYSRLVNLFSSEAARVLLVIGYGFADSELVRNITEGLELDISAYMVVIHPHLTKDSVTSLFPSVDENRIMVINCYFGTHDALQLTKQALTQVNSP